MFLLFTFLELKLKQKWSNRDNIETPIQNWLGVLINFSNVDVIGLEFFMYGKSSANDQRLSINLSGGILNLPTNIEHTGTSK